MHIKWEGDFMEKTIDHPALRWIRDHRHEAIELLRIFLGGLLFYIRRRQVVIG